MDLSFRLVEASIECLDKSETNQKRLLGVEGPFLMGLPFGENVEG